MLEVQVTKNAYDAYDAYVVISNPSGKAYYVYGGCLFNARFDESLAKYVPEDRPVCKDNDADLIGQAVIRLMRGI